MPKKMRGLGVRDCQRWNVAAIGKYIWQIAQKEDLLWIKWVHSVYIRDLKDRNNILWNDAVPRPEKVITNIKG